MKRFVFYLLLVPIISPLIRIVLDSLIYWDGHPFSFILGSLNLFLLRPGIFLLNAYFGWLPPVLAIATADRFVRSDTLQPLGTIAAVACFSTLLTLVALYVPFPSGWQWGMLVPGIACAIAAIVCRLLLELNREHLSKLGSTIRKGITVLRRWPGRIEE